MLTKYWLYGIPYFLGGKAMNKIGKNSASTDHILGEREASNKIYFKKMKTYSRLDSNTC